MCIRDRLGFGLMRLPMLGEEIDIEQVKKMADTFMSKGFTYFDTAYVYIGGKSEVALKEAVVDRYPRDSFQCATKLPLWDLMGAAEMESTFQESLDRAGLKYYDFYLLHAMDHTKVKKADEKMCIRDSSSSAGTGCSPWPAPSGWECGLPRRKAQSPGPGRGCAAG